jgi:hypothetical protein
MISHKMTPVITHCLMNPLITHASKEDDDTSFDNIPSDDNLSDDSSTSR